MKRILTFKRILKQVVSKAISKDSGDDSRCNLIDDAPTKSPNRAPAVEKWRKLSEGKGIISRARKESGAPLTNSTKDLRGRGGDSNGNSAEEMDEDDDEEDDCDDDNYDDDDDGDSSEEYHSESNLLHEATYIKNGHHHHHYQQNHQHHHYHTTQLDHNHHNQRRPTSPSVIPLRQNKLLQGKCYKEYRLSRSMPNLADEGHLVLSISNAQGLFQKAQQKVRGGRRISSRRYRRKT